MFPAFLILCQVELGLPSFRVMGIPRVWEHPPDCLSGNLPPPISQWWRSQPLKDQYRFSWQHRQ